MGEPIKIHKGKKEEFVVSAGQLATKIEEGWKKGPLPGPAFKATAVYKDGEEQKATTAKQLEGLVAEGWTTDKPE